MPFSPSILRLLRLARLTRMARLMRSVPELLTLIKGMAAATQSVTSTLVLWIIFLYIFAILFVGTLGDNECSFCGSKLCDSQQMDELERNPDLAAEYGLRNPLEEFFGSMSHSMYTLLIAGTLRDDMMKVATPLRDCPNTLQMLFVFFLYVLLSSFTVLNMLIGVLCEVVRATAQSEHDTMLMNRVQQRLYAVFQEIDRDNSMKISKDEFGLMKDNPEVVAALGELGIEVKHLFALSDSLFEVDDEEDAEPGVRAPRGSDSRGRSRAGNRAAESENHDRGKELSFQEFLNVVCHMRPENQASVLDIADLRKSLRRSVRRLEELVFETMDRFQSMVTKVCNGDMPGPPARPAPAPNTVEALTLPLFEQILDAKLQSLVEAVDGLSKDAKRILPDGTPR